MDIVEQDRNQLVEKMKIIENQRDDLLRKGKMVESERNNFLRSNKLMEMQKDDLEGRCNMLQKTNVTLNARVSNPSCIIILVLTKFKGLKAKAKATVKKTKIQ